jgi:hypothetical protein
MNIVRITSGLGNQIFQYAFYRALKERNLSTKMDISEFKHRKHHNGYELEKIFNIESDYANRKECDQLADVSKDLLSDIRRKYFKRFLNCTGNYVSEGEIGYLFHKELLVSQNSYFHGFWQTEKYFADISLKLKTELTFKIPFDITNKNISEEITNLQSVSIHIRRGDYLKKRRIEITGSVCSIKYYNLAIDYIKLKINNPRFYVFSDDMEWVKANIKIENAYYVDNNIGKNSYKDMQLMSLCKHNIIANSSFSWWGAWLNSNPEKIVVAPSIWFRGVNMPDIIPETWIKVSIN